MPTVKFRPDQPLFKADAFRMPLWVHAPFEIARGFTKWLTVSLQKDNPHRNVMHNATFTKVATAPHRNAFWTGRPVVKCAKWKTMVWRWGLVFTLLAIIKYLPAARWWWLCRQIGSVLKWVGLTVIPFGWAHLWSIPLFIAGVALFIWLTVHGVRGVAKRLRERNARNDNGDRWYMPVLYMRDRFVSFVNGRGERS